MEPQNNDQLSQLPPTKIKRKYICKLCGHLTINPREHLKHRKITHNQRVKIVECPLCVYACQYRQKLNRHLRLVHKCFPEKNSKQSTSNRSRAVESNQQANNQYELQDEQQSQSFDYNDSCLGYNSTVFDGLHSILSQMIPSLPANETVDEPVDLSFPADMKTLIRHIKSQCFNTS